MDVKSNFKISNLVYLIKADLKYWSMATKACTENVNALQNMHKFLCKIKQLQLSIKSWSTLAHAVI